MKKQLFNCFDELLKVRVSPFCLATLVTEVYIFMQTNHVFSACTYMYVLLNQVFTGEAELCLEVKEQHIAQIFEIMIDTKNPRIQVQFIKALQAMAKVCKHTCIL